MFALALPFSSAHLECDLTCAGRKRALFLHRSNASSGSEHLHYGNAGAERNQQRNPPYSASAISTFAFASANAPRVAVAPGTSDTMRKSYMLWAPPRTR